MNGKQFWIFISILLVISGSIVGFAAVTESNHRAHSLWLNYRVSDSGMISLLRPELSGAEQERHTSYLISFIQLPESCLASLDVRDWDPKTQGSIRFNKDWCRVDRYSTIGEDEGIVHYKQLVTWLKQR